MRNRTLTEVNHELHDLQPRNPLLPPDADTSRALEIVPVHNYMHEQVERDWNPRHWGVSDELCVAQERGCWMMVAVKECYVSISIRGWPEHETYIELTQGLLLEKQEDGIQQFDIFDEVIKLERSVQFYARDAVETYIVQSDKWSCPPGACADGIVKPGFPQRRNDLSGKEKQ